MTIHVNRKDLDPKFTIPGDALEDLSVSGVKALITLTDEGASRWKVRSKRGHVVRFGHWYGINATRTSGTVSLPAPDFIRRIDWADGYLRQEAAPFYVRGEE